MNINGISSFWNNTIPDGDEEGPWKRGGITIVINNYYAIIIMRFPGHSSVIANGRSFTFGGYGLFVGKFLISPFRIIDPIFFLVSFFYFI